MQLDPILYIDGYKVGHKFQYHEDTEIVFSNLTARSNARAVTLPNFIKDEILWFGISAQLQVLIEDFQKNFFDKPLEVVLAKYKRRMDSYLGPDSVDTKHIEALHNLGYLPVVIQALPEGTIVPTRVPVMLIWNTDREFFWIVNYLETILSAMLWQMTTSATTAFQYRCLLEQYAIETGSPVDFVAWQGHDFSFRGMPGLEAASTSGAAHLTSFLGTDTLPAIDYIEQYYDLNADTYVAGSVPASEHSVASSNILFLEEKYATAENPKLEAENEFFNKYITQIYPSGVCSYVSDTYDFWSVITEIATRNKEAILNRKPNHLGLAKVVFRPDSGDPVEILCGTEVMLVEDLDIAVDVLVDKVQSETPHGKLGDSDPEGIFKFADGKTYKVSVCVEWNRHDKQYYYVDGTYNAKAVEIELTPEEKGAVETLWDIFGGTETDKGYKLLNQRVGLIYGDSITLKRAEEILRRLKQKGFASGNVVFGVGSFTYQHVTRDTHGTAMKTTFATIQGLEVPIFKDPKTDDGTKKSAKGLLDVIKNESGTYELREYENTETWFENEFRSVMEVVFLNGEVTRQNFQDIRNRVNKEVKKKLDMQ